MTRHVWTRLAAIGGELLRFLTLRPTSRLHQLAYLGDLAEQRMVTLGGRDANPRQPQAAGHQ